MDRRAPAGEAGIWATWRPRAVAESLRWLTRTAPVLSGLKLGTPGANAAMTASVLAARIPGQMTLMVFRPVGTAPTGARRLGESQTSCRSGQVPDRLSFMRIAPDGPPERLRSHATSSCVGSIAVRTRLSSGERRRRCAHRRRNDWPPALRSPSAHVPRIPCR